MKHQKRPTEAVEYTLEEHKTLESAPVFTLKPLSVGRFDEVVNLITAEKKATAFRYACQYGIKGWTNYEPDFEEAKVVEITNDFTLTWIIELGSKIIEISQVSEQEKN